MNTACPWARRTGSYGVRDAMTVGQAVIFAGRIRSLYRTGDPERGPAAYKSGDQAAAVPYLLYLQAEGVLDTALDGPGWPKPPPGPDGPRAGGILPEEALPPVYDALITESYATHRFITDVTEYTPYYQDILSLYRKGIAVGSDARGSFLPEESITRGAAAAMLTRMVDPALRRRPSGICPQATPPRAPPWRTWSRQALISRLPPRRRRWMRACGICSPTAPAS